MVSTAYVDVDRIIATVGTYLACLSTRIFLVIFFNSLQLGTVSLSIYPSILFIQSIQSISLSLSLHLSIFHHHIDFHRATHFQPNPILDHIKSFFPIHIGRLDCHRFIFPLNSRQPRPPVSYLGTQLRGRRQRHRRLDTSHSLEASAANGSLIISIPLNYLVLPAQLVIELQRLESLAPHLVFLA
ncbi:hypothetical protein F5Y08DRAFT_110689 [Xylaria arbuscula]|nr:hypothetical protein F5Y08DRAFT_110689 [Xylaria arbuscula]